MLGLIFLFLCGWLIYAGLCRLVFGKTGAPEYYIVREYDIEVVVDEVMDRLYEEEPETVAEELRELPDNVILFDRQRRDS
jgi:hypothetical protein